MTVRIDDPNDPRIAAYRQVRERDLVGREGRFIAEGEVVLRVLLGSALCRTVSILIDEQRLERLSGLLSNKPDQVPLYVAAQPVIDAIAGFHLHRGILALGEPRLRPLIGDLLAGLSERALVVGLFGIGNHDNMGGLFRNAAAFGADAVILGADCCDPFYRKAIRVSVGASLVTPFAWAREGEDVIGALEAAGFEILALSPAGSASLADIKRAPRSAILLGAEGPGLPDEILGRVTTVRIPMAGRLDSLNVATASGIVLHHLSGG